MIIHAVTFDCWGTLLLDSPGSDERYASRRLAGFEKILNASGIPILRPELDRAYEASGRWLARTWRKHQDVPVSRHVRAILEAVDPALPERLAPQQLVALMQGFVSAVAAGTHESTGGPDSIPAGLTTVRLTDTGKEPHHVQMWRLNPDTTPDQFAAALRAGLLIPHTDVSED